MLKEYLSMIHEQAETDRVHSAIVKFLKDNPKPSDPQIHALAGELEIDEHRFEEEIYAILGMLLKGVGKHQDDPDDKFDSQEMIRGIKVELEHTDSRAIAKEITKDHLAECPDYYRRLEVMEKECEK